jgi:hypothetical protein
MKYIIGTIITLVLGYFSINIKPLDEVMKSRKAFDAKAFAENFLSKTLVAEYPKAIELNTLIAELNKDKQKTFEQLSHGNAIGNIRYFLVKGQGQITSISDDQIIVKDGNNTYGIETEYIYGAAIRDASGAFDMKQFSSFNEINALTSEINACVRKNVEGKIKPLLKVGGNISFIGALEMNQQHTHVENIKVEPIEIKIL